VSARVGERADTADVGARRRALVQELRAIELEWSRVRAGLVELGPGERLPGLHLVVALGAGRLLLPAARVAEIARIVACDPIPGAPPWVLGTFVWRGRPAVAADLGARLGGERASSVEAIMVILDGTPTVALVVDGVRGLVEDPLLADGVSEGTEKRLVVGACRVDDEAVPALAPEALERELREGA
jgi:chemotaxis signal transduction protein